MSITPPAILPEHKWLQLLVGEWTNEIECISGPDSPAQTQKGTEIVRSLGGLWTIGEGKMGSEGGEHTSIMTLGYDPLQKLFVGTFIASMMTHLWTYRGSLDAASKILTLDAEGPSFVEPGKMAMYHDIIEFVDDDHRLLSSECLGPDGVWTKFMTAHYYRKGR
ncbi:MAG: DUF1579 domain-containing protein [Planctomycetota bacterium]|jgi:hypothetical protein